MATVIVNSGTRVMPDDVILVGQTIEVGSTTGPAAGLVFTGDTATTPGRA